MLDWPTHMEWPNTHARTYEDTHTKIPKSRKRKKRKQGGWVGRKERKEKKKKE